MGNYLYTNRKGFKVSRHSYSAGQDWEKSPYLYYLKRVMGWRERATRAAFKFGLAVESGINFYHANKGSGALDAFDRYWAAMKQQELVYTDKEGSWEELSKDGRDMLRLYEIRKPIPWEPKVRTQAEIRKEVFPRSILAGIEFVGYTDMLVPRPESGHAIIDCKVVASDPPKDVEWDDQLRVYSWATGFREVGFLWFTKATTGGFKRGHAVTILVGAGEHKAGAELVVLSAAREDGQLMLVAPEVYEAFAAQVKGKKEKEIAAAIADYSDKAVAVPAEDATKQRVALVTGKVSEESAREAGEVVGQQIAEIVMHREKNWWPRKGFGVKWPNDSHNDLQTRDWFRAFVLGDEEYRKEVFVQDGEPEDWLDRL